MSGSVVPSRGEPSPLASPQAPSPGSSRAGSSVAGLTWKSLSDPFIQFSGLLTGRLGTTLFAQGGHTSTNKVVRKGKLLFQRRTLWECDGQNLVLWELRRSLQPFGRSYKPCEEWKLHERTQISLLEPRYKTGTVHSDTLQPFKDMPPGGSTDKTSDGLHALAHLPGIVQDEALAVFPGSFTVFGDVVQESRNGVASCLTCDAALFDKGNAVIIRGKKNVTGNWEQTVDQSPWEISQINAQVNHIQGSDLKVEPTRRSIASKDPRASK